ncbi:hypothetical protein [Rathayibacter sp. AY1C9]|uniref:hypothetical protein n=1 Tax=Rathayibacter sp. AY1C9 TaxID=2080541 RepID=UPI0011B01789|nr:hypothetical protein [Rathayibacter sp. AY1C9]
MVEQLGQIKINFEPSTGPLITVLLDSSTWNSADQASAARNPGQAFIDGTEVDWPTLRSKIQVRRVAGDETLGETIGLALHQRAQEVAHRAEAVNRLTTRWSNVWAGLLGTPQISAREGLALIDRSSRLEREREELDERRRSHEEGAERANQALSDLQVLERIDARLASLREYEDAWTRRSTLKDDISRLEEQLLNSRNAGLLGSRDDFAKLARLVRLRTDAYTRAHFDEAEVLRSLGLRERPSRLQANRMLTDARTDRAELEKAKKTQYAAGSIREVTVAVERTLLTLPNDLHDEVVVELDREITASELIQGLSRRRSSLRDVPKSDAVIAIEAELTKLSVRIRLLESFPQIVSAVDRKSENLENANKALDEFLQLSESERQERDYVTSALTDKRDQFVAATSEALLAVMQVRAAAGVDSVTDNASQLIYSAESDQDEADQALDDLGDRLIHPDALKQEINAVVSSKLEALGLQNVTLDLETWRTNLPARMTETMSDVLNTQRQLDATIALERDHNAELTRTRAEVRSLRSHISAFANSLATSPGWGTLREAVAPWMKKHQCSLDDLPDLAESLTVNLDAPSLLPKEAILIELVVFIGDLIEELEDAASTVRDRYATATAFLQREAHNLAPRLVHQDAQQWHLSNLNDTSLGHHLSRWVEGEVSDLLSQDVLRRELFDDASEVDYDLEGRAVVWRSSDGKRRRRPLEAFSSGEQVFAYTRAKLETLKNLSSRAEYVLVFLDEFGAFVARDRFGQLMQYVRSDVLGTIASQVVVMLPSSDNQVEFEARTQTALFAASDYVVESLAGDIERAK